VCQQGITRPGRELGRSVYPASTVQDVTAATRGHGERGKRVRTVRGWWQETGGGLPRTFWYIWSNTLINRVGSFVVILLAIYLTQQRHLSPTYAGFVIGLWGVGGAVGTLIGGVLADRWGRKPTFLTALYSSAAMMLILGLARGAGAITVAVLFLGVASEAARPAMAALMIDVVGVKDRLRAFTLNYWAINLGFALAATTAGLVAGVNYELLFVIDATTTVAAATLVAVKVREPVRATVRPAPTGTQPTGSRGLLTVFRDRVFMGFVAVNLLTSIVFMQHRSTLPITMARDGLSASTYGSVIALNGILIVAGQLFVTRVLSKMRRSTGLAAASIIAGAGFGLNALAHTPLVYGLAVCVWTIGEMLNSPSNSASNAELSPADMRGRYQGVSSLSWSAASFLAPVVGGAVLQYAGDVTLWLACFAVGLLVAVLHKLAGPARERRAAELREQAARAVAADAALTASAAKPATAPSPAVDEPDGVLEYAAVAESAELAAPADSYPDSDVDGHTTTARDTVPAPTPA
jgi:MFS family permease